MPLAAALVADLEGVVAVVDDEARPLYHAAMSHAANHLVTLITDAAELLRRAGVDQPAAALAPITRAALANALASGDAALTGPVARGDAGTIAAHLEALQGNPVEASYVAMADPYGAAGARLGPAAAPARRPRCSTCSPAVGEQGPASVG